jgi:hypothetical protein
LCLCEYPLTVGFLFVLCTFGAAGGSDTTIMVETCAYDTDDDDDDDDTTSENDSKENTGHPQKAAEPAKTDGPLEPAKSSEFSSKACAKMAEPKGNCLHDIKAAMSKVFDVDKVLLQGQTRPVDVFKHPSHYFTKTNKAYSAYNYLNKKQDVRIEWKAFAKVVRNCINNNRRKVLGTATDLDAPKVFNGKKDDNGNKATPEIPAFAKTVKITSAPLPASKKAANTALVSPESTLTNSNSIYSQQTQVDTAATAAAKAVEEANGAPPKRKVSVCVLCVTCVCDVCISNVCVRYVCDVCILDLCVYFVCDVCISDLCV